MLEVWIGLCSKIRKWVELLAYVVGTWLDRKLGERERRGGGGGFNNQAYALEGALGSCWVGARTRLWVLPAQRKRRCVATHRLLDLKRFYVRKPAA